MFDDREDAGIRLAKALERYKGKGALVLGIPRGGVIVACVVAKYLEAEFSIIVSRKLPLPQDPEAGFGAIAEDGSIFMFGQYKRLLSKEVIAGIIEEQKKEVARRIKILRGGKELPEIKDRTVILVDDGIAMGSTMAASIQLCKNRKAKKIVVAIPVSGEDVEERMKRLADEVVILEKPFDFYAVAQAYRNWYDVSDEEVLAVLKKYA